MSGHSFWPRPRLHLPCRAPPRLGHIASYLPRAARPRSAPPFIPSPRPLLAPPRRAAREQARQRLYECMYLRALAFGPRPPFEKASMAGQGGHLWALAVASLESRRAACALPLRFSSSSLYLNFLLEDFSLQSVHVIVGWRRRRCA
ncbi:hypothetical protein GUJ93_ZPchr0010g8219 [Zizania palustris]|uniref:Uncharacterized protein n=1 Tax=Zizania palustris TaxID=103762 RepID=A0A8J5WDI6_ZIZPA|nr:hypothetical protein GUJ93_ZPchr0010g8219 [Zizania palustris]